MNHPSRSAVHAPLLFAVACGVAGAAMVYVGDAQEWSTLLRSDIDQIDDLQAINGSIDDC
jgi:hypothetical protein